jgi:hypothetical protein
LSCFELAPSLQPIQVFAASLAVFFEYSILYGFTIKFCPTGLNSLRILLVLRNPLADSLLVAIVGLPCPSQGEKEPALVFLKLQFSNFVMQAVNSASISLVVGMLRVPQRSLLFLLEMADTVFFCSL